MDKIKLGLVGEHISYSLSPKIHALLFECFGVKNATYELIDISKQNFDDTIKKITQEFYGFNVTKPYKNQILQYVDKNYSEVTNVNTCVCGKQIKGYNTDVGGFRKSFLELCPNPSQGITLVLGAGGAAESIAYILKMLGANVYFYNRTFSKAKVLAEKYGHKTLDESQPIKPRIIINSTTLGLDGEQSLPDFVDIGSLEFAYDTIYNPPLTPFLLKAKNNGANIQNGFDMLIYQAILSENIWFDLKLGIQEIDNAYEHNLNYWRNLQ